MWLLGASPAAATASVVALSLAVFVPLKYVYPSKLRECARRHVVLACAWGRCWSPPSSFPERAARLRLVELSLAFPVYYVAPVRLAGGLAAPRTDMTTRRTRPARCS